MLAQFRQEEICKPPVDMVVRQVMSEVEFEVSG